MSSLFRIYAFFFSVLIFSIVFVLKPPENQSKIEHNQEEVAMLELDHFTLFSVVDQKPEAKIVGRKGKQFSDREEFWDFYLTNYNTNAGGLKALNAQNNEEHFFIRHGVHREDRYVFDGGITYSNADGMKFEALDGVYFSQKRIFKTQGKFKAQTRDGIFEGEDLYYDSISEQMQAKFPKGQIWLEN